MITGSLAPTQGEVYQGSARLSQELSVYRRKLGYCPQTSPLLDRMSGSEMLSLFARLRGVRRHEVASVVDQLIKGTDLQVHARKEAQEYSGGTARKLSLALAIIASPAVLLLDEASAGVDANARRRIWRTLAHLRRSRGSSLLFTSHSMQECESLCSRISIMVDGGMRCLGSAQQLRSRFGQGFTISVKLLPMHQRQPEHESLVTREILSLFPSARLTDRHETTCTYRLPDPRIPWSKVFDGMDIVSRRLQLEDYSVSDTTLEQIFIGFARTSTHQPPQPHSSHPQPLVPSFGHK